MRDVIKKLIITIISIILAQFIFTSFFYKVKAENTETDQNSIIESQSKSFGISSFIEEADKYQSEDFSIDVSELFASAVKGNVDNKSIGQRILSILFKQTSSAIKTIRHNNDNSNNIKCNEKHKRQLGKFRCSPDYTLCYIYLNSYRNNEKFFRHYSNGKKLNRKFNRLYKLSITIVNKSNDYNSEILHQQVYYNQ